MQILPNFANIALHFEIMIVLGAVFWKFDNFDATILQVEESSTRTKTQDLN